MSVKIHRFNFDSNFNVSSPREYVTKHDYDILEARCKELEAKIDSYHKTKVWQHTEQEKALLAENNLLKKKLEKARDLFSYEVDRNGCSDEIVAADTADEHQQAVENYVSEHFDKELDEIKE